MIRTKLRLAACALLAVCGTPQVIQAQEISHGDTTGSQASLRIGVDAGRTVGELKPLRGVNGAPDMTFLSPDNFGRMEPPADVSASYREAGINLVRTHDSQGASDIDRNQGPLPPLADPFAPPAEQRAALDLNVIFPDITADPTDPRSYNFGPTDRLVAGIDAIGAETLFRIGRSGMATALPPTDLPRYAEIVRHIVLHYNKGWANGFTNRVRYWEIWNEPDLGGIFWRGTPEQFHAFYATAAKAVRQADPAALVGGPGIAKVNEETPYREGFLAYARAHRLPLDFFSWHYYSESGDPHDFTMIARAMRALLDRYDFKRTTSILDEWNYDFIDARNVPIMARAAFVASSLIGMQDAPIDAETLYRADRDLGEKPTKIGQALLALGRMARTPIRLATTGGDTQGLAVQAGRSADGDTVQVLISNYEIPEKHRGPRKGGDVMHAPRLFDLQLVPHRPSALYRPPGRFALDIARLPSGGAWRVEHFRIDANQDLALVETVRAEGRSTRLEGAATAPAIDLFVLTREHR